VGIVGIKLYFINGSIQHAGVVLGLGGIAGHMYLGTPFSDTVHIPRLQVVRNLSAVTAACMMVKRSVFEEAGCFSPEFHDSYNDVDLCLKIKNAGYLVVWTPYSEALHFESKSRGYYVISGKRRKIAKETALFREKWQKELDAGDPYYNCNFSLDSADYCIK
jgi:GT2 family glycosyltransferase